ncbi:hypothetical protein EXIGLDRAFT_665813 [Exidia glandulosa HHB12029]|uniref:HIT domain-containing protein n=1 Tax=Exidia glandulosa HHB12029 TaxID=1314781 RepID=A0A165PEK2_EXIGL|nr:hypothetical protein EXIGLDRAFT_665813 [Exidia glandulosa HHB12029]
MASQFAARPGCPMCSIASSAQSNAIPPSPLPTSSFLTSSNSNGPDILWRDDNFTAYHEKANPVSSKGHVIILFNLHVPSIYSLSTTDLPLLIGMQRIAQRLLSQLAPPPAPSSPDPNGAPTPGIAPLAPDYSHFKIGFISYPFKDSKIPVTDHLHAHCYVGEPDLAGWWRKMAYGPLAWYSIEDLIAEIRETSTNNRVKVKTGAELRPIDTVPTAGARTGLPDGRETTVASIGVLDPEEGVSLATPATPPTARRQSTLTDPIPRPSSVTPLTAPEPEATPPPSASAD